MLINSLKKARHDRIPVCPHSVSKLFESLEAFTSSFFVNSYVVILIKAKILDNFELVSLKLVLWDLEGHSFYQMVVQKVVAI